MQSDLSRGREPVPFKQRRLNRPSMYRRVFAEGGQLRRFPLALRYYHPGPGEISRVGFVIRKAAGKAHQRNKLRRVLRSVFQAELCRLPRPTWIVFDISKGAWQVGSRQFRETAHRLLADLEGREGMKSCSEK